jgi:PAS domain S-box-containing protein
VRFSIRAIAAKARAESARPKLRSFVIVAGMFPVLLIVSLFASWQAIDLVNATRAYAVGEGRYSKAQKMAVLDLYRYANSENQKDFESFLQDINIPLGDRAARIALSRSSPDTAAARSALLRGQNHPRDIDGLVTLFLRFYWWKPFAAAVEDWRIADDQVQLLIAEGYQLHARVAKGTLDTRTRRATLRRIEALDAAITGRENTFSGHMGEASRLATTLVVWGLGISTVLLWAIGISFAVRLLRRQLALDSRLASSESRFRDYAEVASDWYWEIDAGGAITYVSDRFQRLANSSVESILGTSGLDIIRERSDDPARRDECLAAIAQRRPFRGLSLRFAVSATDEAYYAISGKPTFSPDGAFRGYRGIGTDITSQVNDAHALRDAKERAEVANHAKSEFLANMSHELRTPLNAILGFSDIIRRQMFGTGKMERYCDYANDIHNSGAHLLSIINDILDLSKIEVGQTSLQEEERRLDAMVNEVRALAGEKVAGPRAVLVVVLPEPMPRLLVDPRKFRQILVNLLSNAFKFTPHDGQIVLEAAIEADGIAIAVRDSGIGIAPGDLETVLTPFGQVESAFSRRHHGTGLGLPLAKSLAELHGGTLTLESTLNEGTCVTIRLPASRVAGPRSHANLSA